MSFEPYIWMITGVVVLANAAVFRYRAESLGREEPNLKPGYVAIAKGFVLWLLPPIAMLAVGNALGWNGTYVWPTARRAPTPFDFVCYGVMCIVLIRGLVWVVAHGGAAFLEDHRRVFNSFPSSPLMVKILWTIVSIAVFAGWTVPLLGAKYK
jgi:hypothetical protein